MDGYLWQIIVQTVSLTSVARVFPSQLRFLTLRGRHWLQGPRVLLRLLELVFFGIEDSYRCVVQNEVVREVLIKVRHPRRHIHRQDRLA